MGLGSDLVDERKENETRILLRIQYEKENKSVRAGSPKSGSRSMSHRDRRGVPICYYYYLLFRLLILS